VANGWAMAITREELRLCLSYTALSHGDCCPLSGRLVGCGIIRGESTSFLSEPYCEATHKCPSENGVSAWNWHDSVSRIAVEILRFDSHISGGCGTVHSAWMSRNLRLPSAKPDGLG